MGYRHPEDKTIEGTGGVAPITEETLKDANASLKNTSPKNVTFSIVGSASETDTKVTFEVLKEEDTSVTWKLKEKGSGKVQANAGPGDYEKGGVPISDISGLSSDGSVTAQVSTGEVKNGNNGSGSTGSSSESKGNSSGSSSAGNGDSSSSSGNSNGSDSGQTATGSTDNNSGYSVGNGDENGNIFSKAAQGDGKSIGILAVIAAVIIAAAIILVRRKILKAKA